MAPEIIPELTDHYAETAAIGALFFDELTAIEVLSKCSHKDFAAGENWRIVKCAEELAAEKEPIDLVMIMARLEKHGWLDRIGNEKGLRRFRLIRKETGTGRIKVTESDDVTFANAESAARRVRELGNLRRMSSEAETIASTAKSGRSTAKEISESLRELAIQVDNYGAAAISHTEDYQMMLDHIHDLEEGVEMAESTGFEDFDRATGGLHGGDVVLISGLAKGGKSILALTIIDHIVSKGVPCAIFSLEMTRRDIIERRIAMRAKTLPFYKIRGGFGVKINKDEAQFARETWDTLSKEPLYIADNMFTVPEIMMEAERLIIRHDVKVILFDYLQLVKGTGGLEERISSATRESKILANRFADRGVAVISCNQLDKIGAKEARAFNKISSDHTYGSSAPIKDSTVITNVHIEDAKFICGCKNQVEVEKLVLGGLPIEHKRPKHDRRPKSGYCDECGSPVTQLGDRAGTWRIERARSAAAGIAIDFQYDGEFMQILK